MRKIVPELVELIDRGIPLDPAEVHAIDPATLFVMALSATLGIQESGGNNKGHFVEEIQSTVSKPMGQAWCMDEVQTAVAYVELKLGVTSPLVPGEHCLTVYRDSQCKLSPPLEPTKGDVIIFEHKETANGHAASILAVYGGKFAWTVEGNTSPGPGMNRDGDGVYCRMRSLVGPTGDMKILGVLRPFP